MDFNMITKELQSQYDSVINHLESRKAACVRAIEQSKRELEIIEQTLPGIKRLVAIKNDSEAGIPKAEDQKFANMSMRWGILHILGKHASTLEDGSGGMASADIAARLKAGGLRSNGQNFNGNVSAILSDMKSKRKEVVLLDTGKWEITQVGQAVLSSIKFSIARSTTTMPPNTGEEVNPFEFSFSKK